MITCSRLAALHGEGIDVLSVEGRRLEVVLHGDVTVDTVCFSAEASDLISDLGGPRQVSGLQVGDSSTVNFALALTDTLPDASNLAFTARAATRSLTPTYYHSDFLVPTHAPLVRVESCESIFVADSSCVDTTWYVLP